MTRAFDDPELVNLRAARLGALLAATDDAPRSVAFPAERIAQAARHAVWVRRLRIAAAAALLLVGAGVPPVRAWIVGSMRSVWHRIVAPPPAPATVATPPAPAAPLTMGAVTVPVGDEFVLRVASRQAEGAITIETIDGRSARVAVVGERDAAELLVLGEGVRIANGREGRASYAVQVPAGVRRVVIYVAGESARTFHPAVGERITLALARNRPTRSLQD